MDVEQIRKVGRALSRFLDEFSDCFGRCDTRAYFYSGAFGLSFGWRRHQVLVWDFRAMRLRSMWYSMISRARSSVSVGRGRTTERRRKIIGSVMSGSFFLGASA